jgi:hypothetical protein
MDKVSKTPRTDAIKGYQERCEMLHGDKIVTHAMCFARASEEADELHSLCEKMEEELAAQKEQFRVLEDEMLVLGDERNAAQAKIAALLNFVDKNMTFYDVDADSLVDAPNIPVLAHVSNRIWYHATDDTKSYPFSAVIDAAIKECGK